MVDVAAIFDDVFGPGDQDQRVSKNRCARCVGVPEGHKTLESQDTLGTLSEASGHTSNQGVPDESERCARGVVEKQELTAKVTKAHRAHRKMNTSPKHPDPTAFEERSAICEHDGGSPRQEAETLAARERGFSDASSLHRELVERWATEIEWLTTLPAVSPDGAEALKRARAFIRQGWALQAVRLGWDEVELFGVCPSARLRDFAGLGIAFGGEIKVITQDAIFYVGGRRRDKATVNSDGGWSLIAELVGQVRK